MPPPTMQPVYRHELRALIERAIAAQGPACDLNHVDVSRMKDFAEMFMDTPFVGDISTWDMSNARNLTQMFQNCPFNRDVSRWNVSGVTDMTSMFERSPFNGDISHWDTSSLVHASGMFGSSHFTGDVSRWNTSSLANANGMFRDSVFNGDISKWDVSSLSNCSAMFARGVFNGDLSAWNPTQKNRYCYFADMFKGNDAFAGDLSHWSMETWGCCIRMFTSHFQGILPHLQMQDEGAYACYAKMFDSEEAFDVYLNTRPFNRAHAEVLASSAIRPPWFSQEDYLWFKEVTSVARSIGMDATELAFHAVNQYNQRHGIVPSQDNLDITDLELASP